MVTIRPLAKQDLLQIHSWESDPLVSLYYNSGVPIEPSDSLDDYPNYYIINQGSNLIGATTFKPWKGMIYSSYYLAKQYRGKGLATEVTKARLEYAKNAFPHLSGLVSFVDEYNVPAWKTLFACGFLSSGIEVKGSRVLIKESYEYHNQLQFIYLFDKEDEDTKLLSIIHDGIRGFLMSNVDRLLDQRESIQERYLDGET